MSAYWSGPGFTDHLTSAIMRLEVSHGEKKALQRRVQTTGPEASQ